MQQSHKQPQGFATFFLTEMWERYGFYTVQTLLVFFLLEKLKLDDNQAYVIVGSFTALAYINCLFGGLVADKLIGYNKTVVIGGISLIIGYSLLGASNHLAELMIGLAFVSVGTGFLKPNVSSMVSLLYTKNDPRKDAGYTLYYVGIYVGALSGSLLGGYFNNWFGHMGAFFGAAVGIVFSVVIFIMGTKKYNLYDNRHSKITVLNQVKALIAFVILVLVSFFVLESDKASTWYFILIGVFCLGFIIYNIVTHDGVQRSKLIAFLILVLLSVLYWAIFFQQFFSLSLCTERVARLSIPNSAMPSIESLGVILFGPLLNWVWFKFEDKKKPIGIAAKFSLGFLFNAICFIILCLGLWYAKMVDGYLAFVFIALAYLVIAIGELCLSPTSLSMVTSLVPDRLTSAMMGISLLSIGFGGKFAGLLASDASVSNHATMTLDMLRDNYLRSFLNYFFISVATYIVALILIKFINRLVKA